MTNAIGLLDFLTTYPDRVDQHMGNPHSNYGLDRLPVILFCVLCGPMLHGCILGPLHAPVGAGLTVYKKGARHSSVTVQLNLPPPRVYKALYRVFESRPDARIVNEEEGRHLLEVLEGERNIAAQATALDTGSTLLIIWVDAGNGGETGRGIASRVAKEVCAELDVFCEIKEL